MSTIHNRHYHRGESTWHRNITSIVAVHDKQDQWHLKGIVFLGEYHKGVPVADSTNVLVKANSEVDLEVTGQERHQFWFCMSDWCYHSCI